MGVSVIIERIRGAVNRAELRKVPSWIEEVRILSMADLMRPWDELYSGEDLDEAREGRELVHRGLRRPKFLCQMRRSRRPLGAPARVNAPPKLISPFLCNSARAIWAFYESKGIADPKVISGGVDTEGFARFIGPLEKALAPYYPLGMWLESWAWDNSPEEMGGIPLLLPHWTYDDEGIEVVDAFLSGPNGVHSLLAHYYGNPNGEEGQKDGTIIDDIELPSQDKELITKIGLGELVEVYSKHLGKKSFDLLALENFHETYFGPVNERFPELGHRYDLITDDPSMNCELRISCKEDIEYAIEFSKAYDKLYGDLPDLSEFSTNYGGVTENFIHELCQVWRKENGKRSVKWGTNKTKRLAYRFREGTL